MRGEVFFLLILSCAVALEYGRSRGEDFEEDVSRFARSAENDFAMRGEEMRDHFGHFSNRVLQPAMHRVSNHFSRLLPEPPRRHHVRENWDARDYQDSADDRDDSSDWRRERLRPIGHVRGARDHAFIPEEYRVPHYAASHYSGFNSVPRRGDEEYEDHTYFTAPRRQEMEQPLPARYPTEMLLEEEEGVDDREPVYEDMSVIERERPDSSDIRHSNPPYEQRPDTFVVDRDDSRGRSDWQTGADDWEQPDMSPETVYEPQLEEAESPSPKRADKDGDCNDRSVNLNIALSGSNLASVGGVPSAYPYRSVAMPTSMGMPAGPLAVNQAKLPPGAMLPPNISPLGSAAAMNYPSMFMRHPPSRFGDNCHVSDIDVHCFNFTCTIPKFPFEEETYHGNNACRLIVRPMEGAIKGVDPSLTSKMFEYGEVAPDGELHPGDTVTHRFEGLPSGIIYGAGMVCENQYGRTRYVDRATGRMFRVQLKQGSCPDAPEAPVAVRDAIEPSTIHVQWKVSKDFHGSYERGLCKLVVRRDGYVLTGDMWTTQRAVKAEIPDADQLSVKTFTNMDSKRDYTFLVMCANSFCDSTQPPDFPGWAVSPVAKTLPQCPDPSSVDLTHQSAVADVSITFVNKLPDPVSIYHVSSAGEQERGVCEAGKTLTLPSHVTHVWRARPVGGGNLLAQVQLTSDVTVTITEVCADLSARGRDLVKANAKAAAAQLDRQRSNVANRERAKVDAARLDRRSDEICRSPSSALSEACCAVNEKKSGDDDFSTSPTTSLRVKCESLVWADAVTDKFGKPSVTTGSAPIGCLFDETGAKALDGVPRCYYLDKQTAGEGKMDLEDHSNEGGVVEEMDHSNEGGVVEGMDLEREFSQVPADIHEEGAMSPLQELMEQDEE